MQGTALIFLCSRSYVIKATALHVLQSVASLRRMLGDLPRARTSEAMGENAVAELIEEKADAVVTEATAFVRRLKETAFDWTDGVPGAAGLRRINTMGSSAGLGGGTSQSGPRKREPGGSAEARGGATDIPQTKSPATPGFESVRQWLLSPFWYIMLACLISACAAHTPGAIRFALPFLYWRLIFHQRHLQVAHKEEVTPEERVRIELWRNYAIVACAGCRAQVTAAQSTSTATAAGLHPLLPVNFPVPTDPKSFTVGGAKPQPAPIRTPGDLLMALVPFLKANLQEVCDRVLWFVPNADSVQCLQEKCTTHLLKNSNGPVRNPNICLAACGTLRSCALACRVVLYAQTTVYRRRQRTHYHTRTVSECHPMPKSTDDGRQWALSGGFSSGHNHQYGGYVVNHG